MPRLTPSFALLPQHWSNRSSSTSMSQRAGGWSRQDGSAAGRQAGWVGWQHSYPPRSANVGRQSPLQSSVAHSGSRQAAHSPTMNRSNMRSQQAMYCWVDAVH